MEIDRKPKLFYGYIVVVAGFVVSLLMWGTYNSFGIFFKPLSSELGWTRATTSGAFSLAFLMFGFLSIIAGRLTDRLGPRVVMIACGFFLGAGYLLMSQVSVLWQFYLLYGVVVGAGMSAADAPVLATVARWFVKRRGLATGIAKTGAGVGIMLIPPLVSWFISSHGWRSTYVIIGVLVMIGVVSVALLFKRDPEEIGQLPDGATKIEKADSNIYPRQFSLREVIGSRQFWILASAWFLILFCVQIVLAHIAPHATDLGISPTTAATIVSTIGGASIVGRVGMGSVHDKLGGLPAAHRG